MVVEQVPALLDVGADRTVIPLRLVEELAVVKSGEATFEGLGGNQTRLALYFVQVVIHDLPPVTVEAAADPQEPYMLLGRDVLNQFRIVLDGPQLALEIHG